MAIFRQGPPTTGVECRCSSTNRDYRRYSWLSIDDVLDVRTTSATIHRADYRFISEAIFITACSMDEHDKKKKTEHNLFVAAVNLKRNLRSTYCIEATDRHKASRGLSATVELLVNFAFKGVLYRLKPKCSMSYRSKVKQTVTAHFEKYDCTLVTDRHTVCSTGHYFGN